MEGNAVSVERIIKAPAEKVFALVADASKHPMIDGSGTVQAAQGDAQQLALGSTFGMSMKAGLPYSMVSQVIEYEENRRIAWQTKAPGPLGLIVGGRIWRFELEPVDGGVRVTETWDISRDRQKFLLRVGSLPERTKANITKTLERIASIVEAPAA